MRTEALKRIGLGIVCVAALAACGAEKIITEKELGYQITLPDGWVEDTKYGRGRYFVSRAEFTYGWFWADVTSVQEGESLRSFIQSRRSRKSLESFTLVDIQKVKLDGAGGIKLTVKQEGCKRAIYYVIANGHGYVITLGSHPTDFDSYVKEFDAIAKSFKLIVAK